MLADDTRRWFNAGMIETIGGREGSRLASKDTLLDFRKLFPEDYRVARVRCRLVQAQFQGRLDL